MPARSNGSPIGASTDAAGAPAVLEVDELGFDADGVGILAGISFALEAGQLAVVMGTSGSGKTTLLRCLNRLIEPSSGQVRLDGVDTTEIPAVEVRRRIGMVSQIPYMFPGTVRDNLQRAAEYSGSSIGEDGAARLLGRVGFDGGLDREARTLSVGQQQRVAVARAIVCRPRLLLFDEPTASLDREASLRLEATLRELAGDGMTMLFVTHDGAQADRIADRVLLLERGELREIDGRPPRGAARGEA